LVDLPSLSRREFAAHVGKSPTVIQRLVAAGKLPTDADGKIPMPAGLIAYSRVRALEAPPSPPPPKASPPSTPSVAGGASGGPPRSPGRMPSTIVEAELLQKTWDARNKELKFLRDSGELVAREDVIADARAACNAIRAALLALPSRVALQVEALAASEVEIRAARIEALIADEVNQVLVQLNSSRFARGESMPARQIELEMTDQ
jgi:hypothetical protein